MSENFAMKGCNPILEKYPLVDPKSDLRRAIVLENLKDIYMILEKHPELADCEFKVEGPQGFSTSPLILACQTGSFILDQSELKKTEEIIGILLKLGANPNRVRKCEGYTHRYRKNTFGPDYNTYAYTYESNYSRNDTVFPLMTLARKGHSSLLQRPLEGGADCNQTNSIGQSVLHVCHPCHSEDEIETLKILLRYNADVNMRDNSGRTPLHCACERSPIEVINLLLEAGAEGNIIDSNGFSDLHLAAHSEDDAGLKIERLLKQFSYLKQVIIEAYETLALTLMQHCDTVTLETAFEAMRKATLMRQEFNLPKIVLDPLECYGFAKEWETLEELSIYKDSWESLTVQAILARERIYSRRYVKLEPLMSYKSTTDFLSLDKRRLDVLLEHHLNLFQVNNDVTNLRNMFHRWFYLMTKRFEDLDTKSITKMIAVALECCVEMQRMLSLESKAIASQKIVNFLQDSLYITTGLIMQLYRRDRQIQGTNETEGNLAKNMLRDLLKQIPEVTSAPINLKTPVQHVIIENHLTTTLQSFDHDLFRDYGICELLVDSVDLDATDNQGNTLLLLVGGLTAALRCNVPPALTMINCLIDHGAHIYAKNSDRKTILEILQEVSDNDEELRSTIEKLQRIMPSLQNIAAMSVKNSMRLSNSTIVSYIPEVVKKFIDLH